MHKRGYIAHPPDDYVVLDFDLNNLGFTFKHHDDECLDRVGTAAVERSVF